MKRKYWVTTGRNENGEYTRAYFTTEEAAKSFAAHLSNDHKEVFHCLVKPLTKQSLASGRVITTKLAEKIREELCKAMEKGTVNSYYYVDRNTWLSSSFGHGLDAMYYNSCLFGVDFKDITDEIQDVSCIFHSGYLTWSTINRMQAACKLVPYAICFRIIDGEPWLVGNYKQVKVPVDKPFSLMRYVRVLFNS